MAEKYCSKKFNTGEELDAALEAAMKVSEVMGDRVQSDWGQNDKTIPTFVKGRTHWREVTAGETVLSKRNIPSYAFNNFSGSIKITVTEGEDYLVSWDGVNYEVTAKTNDFGAVYLGNYALADDWYPVSDYPFLIYPMTSGTYFYQEGSGDVSCAIYKAEPTYHRLDEAFLPECVNSVVIRSSTEGSTKKFKLTVDDSGIFSVTEVT